MTFRYDAREPTSARPAMPATADPPDAADPLLTFEDTSAAPLRAEGATPWQVLIVDDDDDVLSSLQRALRRHFGPSVDVRTCDDALDALALVRFLFHLNRSPGVPPGWREIPDELRELLMKPL